MKLTKEEVEYLINLIEDEEDFELNPKATLIYYKLKALIGEEKRIT